MTSMALIEEVVEDQLMSREQEYRYKNRLLTNKERQTLPSRWGEMVSLYYRRYRTRRQLARLSADQLRDIGLTPEQAAKEVARFFWQ